MQGDLASNPNHVYTFLNKPRKIATELENSSFDKQVFFSIWEKKAIQVLNVVMMTFSV